MQLRGLESVRDWSIDKGDYMVVGVMRYYSMDSIEEANRRFEPENYKNEEKKKFYFNSNYHWDSCNFRNSYIYYFCIA